MSSRVYMSSEHLYWVIGIVFIILAYSLGLSGHFLLDDYATLPYLEQWGAINSFDKFYQFISSGFTGPTGRPMALLSFAPQSEQWVEGKAFYFLLVNIAIHTACAGLLYLFFKQLVGVLKLQGELATWLPLTVSLIWAAHPLQVSSVLYVIQRMVLLATFFNLICVVVYLKARVHASQGNLQKAFLYLIFAACSALLALFSKENSVLIPLQLLLIEAVIAWQTNQKLPPYFKYVFWLGIVLPSTVVVGYFTDMLLRNIYSYVMTGRELPDGRAFTMFERLFTQLRVIGDYLTALVIPRGQSAGVFFDNYPISKSIFQPISTFVWLCIHLSLIAIALVYRKKLPLLAFGMLWFYVNHLAESTVHMLELKFEHRNYLPSIGIILSIVFVVIKAPITLNLKRSCVGFIFVTCLVTLSLRTSLWGQPEKAALVWVSENERSVRALENAALVLSEKEENFPVVSELLWMAVEKSDSDPVLQLKYISYVCIAKTNLAIDYSGLSESLSRSPINWQLGSTLEVWLDKMIDGRCNQIALTDYQKLLIAVLNNKNYGNTSIPQVMSDLLARSELVFGSKEKAVDLYTGVNYKSIPVGLVMNQALWMASYGELKAALRHLDEGLKYSKGRNAYITLQAEDMREKIASEIESNE